MKLEYPTFRGEIPRSASRLLPAGFAERALNTRLLSGDLEAWREALPQVGMVKVGTIRSIYLGDADTDGFDPYWMHWTTAELGSGQETVDVARGPIPGDTEERAYITGLDVPRVTNRTLATTYISGPVGAFPYATRKMGVPAPGTEAQITISAELDEEGEVTLTNGGAELGTTVGWISTPGGTLEVNNNGEIPGFNAFAGTWYFTGGADPEVEAYQEIDMAANGLLAQQSITLGWAQASGPNGSLAGMRLEFYDDSDTLLSARTIASVVEAQSPQYTWVPRSVAGIIPDDAATIRLVQRYERVGGGLNDAYIDAVELIALPSDFSNDGSTLTGFTLSPPTTGNPGVSNVTLENVGGAYGSVLRFYADEQTPYVWSDFALSGAGAFEVDFDLYLHPNNRNGHYLTLGATEEGAGEGFAIQSFTTSLLKKTFANFRDSVNAATLETLSSGSYRGQWLHIEVRGSRSGTTAFDVTLKITQAESGVLLESHQTSITAGGDLIAWKHYSNEGGDTSFSRMDNFRVRVLPGTVAADGTPIITNVVWTYVNEFGEEGPPSPVSRVFQRPESGESVYTTPTTFPDPAFGIVSKNFYRSATGSTGTDFYFVGSVPLATADFVDGTPNALLTDVLQTVDWDLPPEDGHGILALPNGIGIMFSKNQACVSVANRLHAWPQAYRLNTDTRIVAGAAIDTTVVVGTESSTYLILGSDPARLSMSIIGQRQACVSKRSMRTLRGYGVVYASPDGLVAVAGAGEPPVVTEPYLTRREWQALNPSSIIAVVHDDRYIGFYDATSIGGGTGGFIFDPRENGNGWTWIEDQAQAIYADPISDRLYFVEANALYAWNEGLELRPYLWRSGLSLLPRPASLACMRVEAEDYDDLTVKLYADEEPTPYHTRVINSADEFVLPARRMEAFTLQVEGTSRVRSVEVAEDMEELT